jgi:apolipoprotein N-acyltransferase
MKIRYVLLSVLSGLLLAFSFPNFIENTTVIHTFFFIWFAFVPVFYMVLSGEGQKRSIIYSFITGLVFYLVSLYWLWYVGPMGVFAYVAWFALCLYFAALLSATISLAVWLKNRFSVPFILSLPALLTFSEFVREWLFTGWPVLTPAQSQQQFTFILQVLKVTGVPGLNYMIYFVNVLAALLFIKGGEELRNKWFAVPAAVFVMLFIAAAAANFTGNYKGQGTFKCAVLQANIDQNVNWDRKYIDATMGTFKEMITYVSAENPDIYIWPETGFPGQLGVDAAGRKLLAQWSKGAYQLVGSDNADYAIQGLPRYYNSAFLLNPMAGLEWVYSKSHLVPFGEYIPFQDRFPFIQKVVQRYGYYGFTSGVKVEPFHMKKPLLGGALICYDSFFPEIAREFAKKGAGFLAHLSYETWYGVSPASAQIFTNAALRAVENDLYLVRCVASGISGIVDNKGRIIKTTKLFTREAFAADINVKSWNGGLTIYTRFGDWFPWLGLFTLIFPVLAGRKKQ